MCVCRVSYRECCYTHRGIMDDNMCVLYRCICVGYDDVVWVYMKDVMNDMTPYM